MIQCLLYTSSPDSPSRSQVEFSCDIIGTPRPDITWFKDGFEVYDTRRFGFLVEGDRYILILKEARLTDEGDIRVRATNRAGVASSQATLVVQGEYVIQRPRSLVAASRRWKADLDLHGLLENVSKDEAKFPQ